jgi:radical SAM-linked protein
MRFASHRDIARAVERGVRRAGLPVAHSAGFSPHPKISYSGGAPTGAASEAEYLEISLTANIEPGIVKERLDAALPDGIDVIEVADLAAAPAPRLEASSWQVELPGVASDDAAFAVQAFLAAEHAEVERLTSNGVRRIDARAGVVSLELDGRGEASGQPGYAILRMVVRHLTPAVRPDDILAGLCRAFGLELPSPARVTRLAQGPLDGDEGFRGDVPRARPDAVSQASAAQGAQVGPPAAAQGQIKTARQHAGNASEAYAAAAGAYGQPPRGAERPFEAGCAREPDERDRPNARNRATEQRAS